MKRELDQILKHALTPDYEPDMRLNQAILYQAEEMESMMNKKKARIPAAALAAVLILALGSTAAFAAWNYLSPSQVAKHVEDQKLADAFSGEEAVVVNETKESGGYEIALLGAVAGKEISDRLITDDKGVVIEDCFYAVVSIARADGTPMPDVSEDGYLDEPFFVSAYIKGLNPAFYNIMSMDGSYTGFVQEGVQYRLIKMDNIEIFADQGIYIGVNSGTFYNNNAYLYDETTGVVTENEEFEGVSAVFTLPLDPAKGDPEAAKAYLEEHRLLPEGAGIPGAGEPEVDGDWKPAGNDDESAAEPADEESDAAEVILEKSEE